MSELIRRDAEHAASKIMSEWCKSILQETALGLLKQSLLHKCKDIDNNDLNRIEVNIEAKDIEDAYQNTELFASKWIEKLRCKGQTNFANILSRVSAEGRFLEKNETPESNNDNISETVTQIGWKNPCQIKSLKRKRDPTSSAEIPLPGGHTLENGMHIPICQVLPQIKTETKMSTKLNPVPLLPERRPEWVKHQIKALDEAAKTEKSQWPYRWDVIQKASDNLAQRLIGNQEFSSYDVIPRSSNQNDKTQTTHEVDENFGLFKYIKNLRGARARLATNNTTNANNTTQFEVSRPPSFVKEHELLSMQDIKTEFQGTEQNYLSHKSTVNNTIHAALKPIGSVHLWEQYKQNPNVQYSHSTNKPKKERLQCSKSRQIVPLTKGSINHKYQTHVTRVLEERGVEKEFVEFDLGECFLEMVDYDSNDKKILAFRSIEVSLDDED